MTAHFCAKDEAAPQGVASSTPLLLRVEAIRFEARTIRSIELRDPSGRPLPPVEPGMHLDLALPGELMRSYSLTNGPGMTDAWVIGVNRDPRSTGGSAYLCETLRVGDLLEVTLPRNTFPLTAAPALFFAGGIGVTPILSMIRHLAAKGIDWRLVYAARSRSDAAFLPALAALDPEGTRVHLHFDDAEGTVLDLAAHVAEAPAGTHLYCCGPAPMLDAFEAATADRPAGQVHLERFQGGEVAGAETGFTVVLKRSGREFTVAPGSTIIETLQEAGVRVSYSCRSGVCGTCETRVIEGTPDHRDNLLSERERESGKVMLICCSLAKSERLVLDL
ncbi:PDR/VanB family oxidoreductase (plasmid) [Salipiger sp. H15]|uniref:PDR/VanB family oxidoreductase n=1 Tax=Alloyangia sp. H15 TaxID=3029062 RepID=A0AAU8AQ15_9RHOB